MEKMVLVVEDNPHHVTLLKDTIPLSLPGYNVDVATNGSDCLKKDLSRYSAILLDHHLPDMRGLSILQNITSRTEAPIILMTAQSSPELARESIRYGASDYLVKTSEAFSAVGAILEKNILMFEKRRQEKRERKELKATLDKVIAANKELSQQASTDSLTGLYNRRAFQERLPQELNRAHRLGAPLSLLLMDVDHFKAVNDTYGHLAGDQVLRETARILKDQARNYDIVCRYGGDEFAILLPETLLEDSLRLARRICERIQKHVFHIPQGTLSMTVSIGVAPPPLGRPSEGKAEPKEGELCQKFVDSADIALYHAKRLGRNRVSSIGDVPAKDCLFLKNILFSY